MNNIVIMGKPGSGKGTLSKRLTEEFGYKLVCAGDLLREEKSKGTELGKKISKLIDKGNYVPDNVINKIILSEISKPVKINEFFIIDGYPRTIEQAMYLDTILNIPIIIWLNVSDETTINRNIERGKISGRPDDKNVDIIKQRLKNFSKDSLPIKDFYKDRIININGELSIDEVYGEIMDLLFDTIHESKEISDII
jgi:adenylate kinase